MLKYLLCFALLGFSNNAFSQVYKTVSRPEVTQSSSQEKLTSEGYEFKYLDDGVNDRRAAFSIGQGYQVGQFVPYLPSFLSNSRVVPLVTLNASQSGMDTRSTLCLMFPGVPVTKGLTVQPGIALKGYSFQDNRPVNGLSAYVGVSVNFQDLFKLK